ncbi:uncharacterized protein [Littorina saxatilis]|uniref:uncharacterized protein n=1 Tax=Littorina saxatilis TaxID=31220 RepID=UPI0038B4EB86
MERTIFSPQTIHCPGGITEKDITTFFATTHHTTSCGVETRKALVSFRRHDLYSYTDATFRVVCPWGSVQFVAGSGDKFVCVYTHGLKEQRSWPASCRNLCLGFCRLLVAMATLCHGALITSTTAVSLQEKRDDDDEWVVNLLNNARQCLQVAVCLLLVVDTVYRPESLLHSSTSQQGISSSMSLNQVAVTDSIEDAQHITGDSYSRKPQCFQQEENQHNEKDTDEQQGKTLKIRPRPVKPGQLEQPEFQTHEHQEILHSPAAGLAAAEPSIGIIYTAHGSKRSRFCQSLPDTESLQTSRSNNNEWPPNAAILNLSPDRYRHRAGEPASDQLFDKSWLVRAGLYWFLASSTSSLPFATEHYPPHSHLGFVSAINGGIVFAFAVVSSAAHVVPRLHTQCRSLLSRATNNEDGESMRGASSFDDVVSHPAEENMTSQRHMHVHHEESGHRPMTRDSRVLWLLTLLSSLSPAMVTLSVAAVHVIVLLTSSVASHHKESSPFVRVRRSSASVTLSRQNASVISNCAALALCMCVLIPMAVTVMKILRQRRILQVFGVPSMLLYVCCVTTVWKRDITVLFQEGLATFLYHGHVTGFALTELWRIAQAVFAVASIAAILLPIWVSLALHCLQSLREHKESSLSVVGQKLQRLKASRYVPRLTQAVAVTLALCALLLTFLAGPLPWFNLRTSYSRDFKPMILAVKNVSIHLELHAVALDTLVTLPVCSGDKMAALSGEMEISRDTLSRLGVDQIETFCLQYECPGKASVNVRELSRHYPSLPVIHLGNVRHHSNTKPTEKQASSDHQNHVRSPFCTQFCSTKAYFRGSMPFNASLHKSLAKEIKGNRMYETLHLKSLILEKKNNLMSKLNRQGRLDAAIADTLPYKTKEDDFYFADTAANADSHQHPDSQGPVKTSSRNQAYNDDKDGPFGSSRDTFPELLRHSQHDNSYSNPHTSCMQTLCALQAVSQAGLAAPLLGLAFQAVHLAVQALLVTLKMVMKVEELSVLFDDLKVRVDSLLLDMERGVEERVVFLSIANYSMIYLAYPALMTGCVGMLVGFWDRRGSLLDCRRRRRAMAAVVLPLLVLNVLGIVLTLAWTHIVESLSSLVTLADVTSSPLLGARFLLAAFVCGSASCSLFILLIGGPHSPVPVPYRPCEQDEVFNKQFTPSSRLKGNVAGSEAKRHPKGQLASGLPLDKNLCLITQDQQHKETVSTSPTKPLKSSNSIPSIKSSPKSPGKCYITDLLKGFFKAKQPQPKDKRVQKLKLKSQSATELADSETVCNDAESDGETGDSGGSWLLPIVLAFTACGLMMSCLWAPVFLIRVSLRRQFDTMLTQLEQDSAAVVAGRHLLMSEGQGSCDVMQAVGREVVGRYLSSLQQLELQPLVSELRILRAKADSDTEVVQPVVIAPCVATSFLALITVLYAALTPRLCMFKPQSFWRLTPKGAARALRRMSLLSLAWLLHMSLAMIGPAANMAASVVVEVTVGVGAGFGLAVAAHVALLLASLELRLSTFAPML